MKEKLSVHNLSIESGFSEDELSDAKSILTENLTAFYRRDSIGHAIRENAISKWKDKLMSDGKRSKSDLDCYAKCAIVADLENDIDIKNAIVMNNEDLRDAQFTKNDGNV